MRNRSAPPTGQGIGITLTDSRSPQSPFLRLLHATYTPLVCSASLAPPPSPSAFATAHASPAVRSPPGSLPRLSASHSFVCSFTFVSFHKVPCGEHLHLAAPLYIGVIVCHIAPLGHSSTSTKPINGVVTVYMYCRRIIWKRDRIYIDTQRSRGSCGRCWGCGTWSILYMGSVLHGDVVSGFGSPLHGHPAPVRIRFSSRNKGV
ncbi:hypothetical protein F5148DRAFT_1224208 [Russula earlei]|uniref:Uncharacterized protein n=1 Tax=Russula earlei TaxID=71964 RepID=A0ACC0U0Q3_9AGAM|nr:hypothetical protein F5148DRAFT_1224208 [Russula earlei]